jgi:hypothetical protein
MIELMIELNSWGYFGWVNKRWQSVLKGRFLPLILDPEELTNFGNLGLG